jgi:hypothetical protein
MKRFLMTLIVVFTSPAKAADAPKISPADMDPKIHEVETQAHKILLEGYDVAPVAEIMKKVGAELEKGDLSDARANLDGALSILQSKKGLQLKRPPGEPSEIETRLKGKIQDLQSRMQTMAKEGKDPSSIGKMMEKFGALMNSGDVLEAEKLLDSALAEAK